MSEHELELSDSVMHYSEEGGGLADLLADAIDNASDQDRITWLTENGKRVAAVVPVDGPPAERLLPDPGG